MSDEKFANIQKIDKNGRRSTQLIRVKAKKNVTTENNRTHWGESKHKRLKSRQDTLSQWARKKQMFQRLNRRSTKTWQRNWQSKGKKAQRSVKNTMGDFPTEINSLAVKIEKMESTPRIRPTKVTKSGCKFHNTMRLDNILR